MSKLEYGSVLEPILFTEQVLNLLGNSLLRLLHAVLLLHLMTLSFTLVLRYVITVCQP